MTFEALQTSEVFLADHPLLRTGDLDEARYCVGQKFCDHRLEIAGCGAPLAVQHNHVAGKNISVNYLHYGADVTIDPGRLGSFYLLQIPLSGRAFIQHRGSEVQAGVDCASLLNPDRRTHMQWQASCRKLLLQIRKSHLDNVAEELTDVPLPGPIRFDAEVDMTTKSGAALRQMTLSCAKAIDGGHLFRGPFSGRDLRVEYDLAQALLIHQRSNISHVIDRADSGVSPRGIRLAIEFIHVNLGEPISLRDIAGAADMNVRTLQKRLQKAFWSDADAVCEECTPGCGALPSECASGSAERDQRRLCQWLLASGPVLSGI